MYEFRSLEGLLCPDQYDSFRGGSFFLNPEELGVALCHFFVPSEQNWENTNIEYNS